MMCVFISSAHNIWQKQKKIRNCWSSLTIANFMTELVHNQTKICSIGTTRIDFLSRVIEDICPCTPKQFLAVQFMETYNAKNRSLTRKFENGS